MNLVAEALLAELVATPFADVRRLHLVHLTARERDLGTLSLFHKTLTGVSEDDRND